MIDTKKEQEAGNGDFDYARMSDADAKEAREGLVEEKDFFILPSALFGNVNLAADNDENLNETLERVFNHIESSAKGSSSESSFAGLFDDFDVNNNKLTQVNMDRIVETFANRTEEKHFSHLASYEEIDKIIAEIEVGV